MSQPTEIWEDLSGVELIEIIIEGPQGAKGDPREWGEITGTLSDQADLQAALDAKVNLSVLADTLDPTGFVDPDNVVATYDESAKTVTLTHTSGTIEYYWRGVLKTLVSPWTSSAHPTVAAKYYLKSTDGTAFAWSTAVWAFSDVMVSVAILDSVNAEWWALREVHGVMGWREHEEAHDLLGTYRKSGLGPTAGTYTVNTATDAATTPGFDAGVIKDEDLQTSIAASTEGTYSTARIGASSVLTVDTAATFPFRSSGSYPLINTPSTGAEAATVTNRYINVYEILLPVCQGTSSLKRRRLMLQPQAAYTTLSAAQAEDFRALSLGDLSSPEYVAYTRITYVTSAADGNTGKCRIATGGISYVVGSRASQASVVTGVVPTAENVPFTPAGTIAATNVQAAIAELDTDSRMSDSRHGKLIAYQHTDASLTGTVNETALATFTIPGGTMGANGALRVTFMFSFTGSTNIKTLRLRFGGVSGTIYSLLGTATATFVSAQFMTIIRNRNSASSQIGFSTAGGSSPFVLNSTANITSSVDTSNDVDVVITGQLASSGETITLQSAMVEVLK